MQLLKETEKSEPQCALSCSIGGYNHKLNYSVKTIPNIANLSTRR